MPQYMNFTGQQTQSLAIGASTLYAIVNNSGSAVVKVFDGIVNPLAPVNGFITGSIVCTTAFNASPVKVDYGIRASKGLVVAVNTPGDVTVIYD